jgi:hypothetical protein
MTGVSRARKASHGTRPADSGAPSPSLGSSGRSLRVAQCALILAAVAGLACQSELSEGNGTGTDLPDFGTNPDGMPADPNNPNPVGQTPGSSTENRNPDLGIVDQGQTVDSTGAPLPVDQLEALAQCDTPGPRLIRRLTGEQYRNTLVNVFDGRTDVPDVPVLTDQVTLGYVVDSDDLAIADDDAGSLMTLGEQIADWAVQNGQVAVLSNNCNNLADQNCRQTLIKNLGDKISREPIADERLANYDALFQLGTDFNDGAFRVIAAMVQSPYLLYRRELGPLDRNQNEFALTQYEVASELSYFLVNGPPDAPLMEAAAQGRLSGDEIDAQAQRLLATAEAQTTFARFVRAWTDIDRLVAKAKEGADLTPELRADMLGETERLFLDVLANGGSIGDLFSAPYTFMTQRLADFYGGMSGVTSPDFQKVDISDGSRVPGLLGHGSYLTAHALADNSSPVQRAFVVRERFLCNNLPEVPTNLDTNLKPQEPSATSRERYARHSSEEPCHTCHQLMDPIGFTFEGYDGFGRFRATEAGKPVDTSGGVPVMKGSELVFPLVTYPLDDVSGLAQYLSEVEEVRACFVNNLSYYSYGLANAQKWAPENKVCTDNFIRQEARDSGNTIQSVVAGILHAPHFTRRVKDL